MTKTSNVTKSWLSFNIVKLDYDLDYEIYIFRHLQMTSDTSRAGNAHQFRSTWFNLPSFSVGGFPLQCLFYPFWHLAPFGKVWKFSVGVHDITYLMVIHLSMNLIKLFKVFQIVNTNLYAVVAGFFFQFNLMIFYNLPLIKRPKIINTTSTLYA